MNDDLFRKKSLNRISSPEELDSSMRVTGIPSWIIVCAAACILVAFIIWGIFGKIETKINPAVISDGTSVTAYVSEQDIDYIDVDTVFTVDKNDYQVLDIAKVAVDANSVLNDYAMRIGDYSDGEFVYAVKLDALLGAGNYSASVITESISAISFIFN